jgi:prolipoprotein diacylglyceryl transferase
LIASIPSPLSNGFHLGPLFVHAYGLAYVVAIAAAVVIASWRWERQGGEPTLVQEVALWGVPAGIVGGRLYFLATSWSEVPSHWWGPLAIWDGGLGIWGGIVGGTLAGLWVLHRRGADIPRFLDAAAPALLVAQAIGRIGNYFNQELFGGPSSLPWALQISPEHRPAGYEQYATFHPTFLYELIWNLALAGALVLLGRRRRIRAPGLFALYVAGYSLGRIGEELLRVDPAHHIFGLRLNFYVAVLLFLVGVSWFIVTQLPVSDRRWPRRTSTLFAVGGGDRRLRVRAHRPSDGPPSRRSTLRPPARPPPGITARPPPATSGAAPRPSDPDTRGPAISRGGPRIAPRSPVAARRRSSAN